MPYTHFRLLAYEVPTATYVTSMTADGVSGWNPGRERPAAARVPVAGVTNDDARIRLKRLASAVNSVSGLLPMLVDDNNATLKIFLVPEFYFRPPTVDASYYSNTYPNSVKNQILTALNEMFAHADFTHWLFVCGTILWNSRQDVKSTPLYFNTAITVKGGPHPDVHNRQDAIVSVVEKRMPSGIDGI